jgi:hypothetical protein
MALIFCDSFDHYSASSSAFKYDTGIPPVSASGRRGTQGLNFTDNTSGIVRNIGAQTQVVMMAAFYLTYTDYQSVGNKHNGQIVDNICTSRAFLLGLGYQGIAQMGIAAAQDGSLHVIRGAALDLNANSTASQLVASSVPGAIKFNQWVHIAAKVTPTTCVVRVNNVEVINATVSTIQNGLPSTFSQVLMHGGTFGQLAGAGWAGRVDDLVVLNTSGAANNDFLGDVRVDYLKPNGSGYVSDSVIGGSSPAATRWQSVDDVVSDGDATFVELEEVGDKDSYAHENLLFDSATVFAVQHIIAAAKSETGLAGIRGTQRVNSINANGSTMYPAGGEYVYLLSAFDTSADGSWTLTKLNDSEFGMERM